MVGATLNSAASVRCPMSAICVAPNPPRASRPTQAAIDRRQAATEVAASQIPAARSEEHTSELQSRSDLVCRLLLEKKNYPQTPHSQRSTPHSALLSQWRCPVRSRA